MVVTTVIGVSSEMLVDTAQRLEQNECLIKTDQETRILLITKYNNFDGDQEERISRMLQDQLTMASDKYLDAWEDD